LDRDFLSAMAEPEPPVLPARRDVRERRLRDAWQKVVYRTVLRAVPVQRVAPRQLSLAFLQAQVDESELLPGQPLQVQQASRPATTLRVQEPAPWVLREPRLRALPVQLALLLAQREPRVRSVSLRLVRRWLGVARQQAQQASSARPWQPRPSLLFPLWQPLPLALRPQRLPEDSCALSQRRPQGSNSSASSSP
jgi:hypothetical protein